MTKLFAYLTVLLITVASTGFANEVMHPGGFPSPNGPVAEMVVDIYNFVFAITATIAVLVVLVLLYALWRFRSSRRATAAKFTHNLFVEIVWTVVPAIIVIALAIKSYEGIKYMRTMPENGMTVEVIGYQFGWDFDYPDLGIGAPEAAVKHPTLSIPSNERFVKNMVIPAGVPIKLNVTSKDVIHAVYAPGMGIKIDAIPGRINYQWFQADKVGDFIGQCAELCGAAHAEMFFNVKVLPVDEFVKWTNIQRAEKDLQPLTKAQLIKTAF